MGSLKPKETANVLKEGFENAKVFDLHWEAAKEERQHRFQVEKIIVIALTIGLLATLFAGIALNFIADVKADRLENSKIYFQLILASLLSFVAGKGANNK